MLDIVTVSSDASDEIEPIIEVREKVFNHIINFKHIYFF